MKNKPIDLGVIDPPIWHVLAGDTVYGPYTFGQMRGFIKEGRIARDTQVAPREGGPFQRAGEIGKLIPVFDPLASAREDDTGADQAAAADTAYNLVIMTKLSGVRAEALRRLMNEIGDFAESMPGVFVVRTRTPMQRIRARIEVVVSTEDQVVLVDASHNRIGFIHLGPERDVHVRSVWNAKLD